MRQHFSKKHRWDCVAGPVDGRLTYHRSVAAGVQATIIALLQIIKRYAGNLPPMPGTFPDYPAPTRKIGWRYKETTTGSKRSGEWDSRTL